jgi:hypothetical protein
LLVDAGSLHKTEGAHIIIEFMRPDHVSKIDIGGVAGMPQRF